MKADDLEIIYQRYYQALFIYAFSLTKNKADAEDLVANAFGKALLSFEEGHIQAWLYTVLKNEFYNLYKKKRKIYDEYNLDNLECSIDVLKDIFHQEQIAWLYKQIYSLPAREKEIMLLSLQDDLDDQMISKITHLSIEYIRVIRHRTKKKLIELCQQEELL